MSHQFKIEILGVENSDRPGLKDVYTSQGKVSHIYPCALLGIVQLRNTITHAEYLHLMSKNQKNYKRKAQQ